MAQITMAPASFNADPDVVISQLQSLAKDAPKDATTRKKLYDAARSLTFALEPSGDTIYRFLFAVGHCMRMIYHGYYELTCSLGHY